MSSKFLVNAVNSIAITDVIGLQDELDVLQEEISSGGGGVSYAAGSVEQTNGLVFRNGDDVDKIKNAAGFALIDVFGIGNSLSVNDIQLPTINSVAQTINDNKTKLTQVSYDDTDPQKPITSIGGELDVDKIKNTGHTAEIEFENTGKLLIKCDNSITLSSTLNNIRNVTNQGIDFLDTTELTGIAINPTNSRMDFIKSNIVRGRIDLINNTDLRINANTSDLYLQGGSVNLTGQTQIVMTSTLNNIRNITNQGVDFLDTTELTGLAINPTNTRMDFIKSNIVKGTIALINVNDLLVNAISGDLYLESGTNTTISTINGDVNLSAGGNVTTSNTPTTDNCVVNKSYLEANTQPKPAVYYLGALTDYDPATAPIHTINYIEAGVASFLNIGWNGSSSGGYLQVRLSANYPSSWATISIAEGTSTITNKYKYLPSNPTTAISYNIHTNYMDDGALATCMISPIQTPSTPPAPPIAPTRPVIKITIHNLENADTFGSNVGYVMIIEQF